MDTVGFPITIFQTQSNLVHDESPDFDSKERILTITNTKNTKINSTTHTRAHTPTHTPLYLEKFEISTSETFKEFKKRLDD